MSKQPHKDHGVDPAQAAHEHDDDVVVVPKGSSKPRFLMTALLAVLVLTTFSVSGTVVDVLTGRGRSGAFMSWKHPREGVQTWKGSDFGVVQRNLSKVYSLLQGRSQREINLDDAALYIVAEALARDAGVHVTDAEMNRMIVSRFGGPELYRQAISSYRMSAKDFEETLRGLMRVNRYENMLAAGFGAIDPARIDERWRKEHQEISLQYAVLPVERTTEEARAALPPPEELRAWFDALSEIEKAAYKENAEPTRGAEVAFFPLDGSASPAGVLARYPRPAGENVTESAQNFYNAYRDLLFLRPDANPQDAAVDPYIPFEMVKTACLRDAPALQSISDWLASMKLREEQGEKVVLADEATGMGLAYRQEAQPRAREDWMRIGMPWTGSEFVNRMFDSGEAGRLVPDVVVDAKAILVGRVLAAQDARMPAFEEIADRVREAWVKKKAGELALAKLEALRARFPTEPDPFDASSTVAVEPDDAKFLAAAQEAGLEVKTREGLDPRSKPRADQRTPVELFLRRTAIRHGTKVGTVCKPEPAADGGATWIARVSGARDGDASRMTPGDVQSLTEEMSRQARFDFLKSTFLSIDFMKQRYGLDLQSWHAEKEASGDAPAGGGSGEPARKP